MKKRFEKLLERLKQMNVICESYRDNNLDWDWNAIWHWIAIIAIIFMMIYGAIIDNFYGADILPEENGTLANMILNE